MQDEVLTDKAVVSDRSQGFTLAWYDGIPHWGRLKLKSTFRAMSGFTCAKCGEVARIPQFAKDNNDWIMIVCNRCKYIHHDGSPLLNNREKYIKEFMEYLKNDSGG